VPGSISATRTARDSPAALRASATARATVSVLPNNESNTTSDFIAQAAGRR
jgi:hypothetical protein